MKRVALAVFGTVAGLVMLLSFKTHSQAPASVPVAAAGLNPGAGASGSTPTSGSTPAAGATPRTSSAAAGPTTVTGDAIDTRWGPVQVQITVQGGTITAVNAIVYPQNNGRDQQINAYAIPQLNQEALAAKSAQIDMVSGATYTSEGYLGSLQSALDRAGL